ncbi:MAG: putative peroxiredoxin bcp [Candidatus Thorarchaeota archaeon AB_25]|nr:MAG: putative peroxiredoxin bcp [Candidatus Thorarchaeota archaeon AB_25]
MSGLEVGSEAPDFTLLEAPGKNVTLSEEIQKGPVVLVFYPADFTSVCQEELCRFRDVLADYNNMGANVLGISVDGIFSHKAFKEANNIDFPLLSDWEKKVIKDYNIVHEDFVGMTEVAKRSVFVIDTDRTVVYVWVSEDPGKLPPFDEVKMAVTKLA